MPRPTRSRALGAVLLAAAVLVVLVAHGTARQSRPDRWKKVDEAIRKGLPKTAVAELDPIIESAIREKAYPEAVRAVGRKIALEGTIQGNKPEEKIARMQAAIATAPADMHPAMHAILAQWYWHYFQQNRGGSSSGPPPAESGHARRGPPAKEPLSCRNRAQKRTSEESGKTGKIQLTELHRRVVICSMHGKLLDNPPHP